MITFYICKSYDRMEAGFKSFSVVYLDYKGECPGKESLDPDLDLFFLDSLRTAAAIKSSAGKMTVRCLY